MNNTQIAKLFAQEETKGTGSNLFIEDNVIYSYGYHFPIALRLKEDNGFKFIFNSSGYSVTTSKHKNYVKCAIGESNILFFVDTNKLKELVELNVENIKELMALKLE